MAALPSLLLPLLLAGGQPPAAKRLPPPVVRPVTARGVTYRAPNETPGRAVVTAEEAATGRLLWEVTVFETPSDPGLEADIQWVFITRLRVRGGVLEVADEARRVHVLDLRTHKVTRKR